MYNSYDKDYGQMAYPVAQRNRYWNGRCGCGCCSNGYMRSDDDPMWDPPYDRDERRNMYDRDERRNMYDRDERRNMYDRDERGEMYGYQRREPRYAYERHMYPYRRYEMSRMRY